MRRPKFPLIALEGVPFVLICAGAGWFLYTGVGAWTLAPVGAVLVLLFLLFRDPSRQIPSVPLGVVSPVDGVVESIRLCDRGVTEGKARIVTLRISPFGTYTARSPVEGKISNLKKLAGERFGEFRRHALLLVTDEGAHVVLQFQGYPFGIAPRGLKGYGERHGQGQRCAYLRLARRAEVHLPDDAQLQIEEGDRVAAASTLIAKLSQS